MADHGVPSHAWRRSGGVRLMVKVIADTQLEYRKLRRQERHFGYEDYARWEWRITWPDGEITTTRTEWKWLGRLSVKRWIRDVLEEDHPWLR